MNHPFLIWISVLCLTIPLPAVALPNLFTCQGTSILDRARGGEAGTSEMASQLNVKFFIESPNYASLLVEFDGSDSRGDKFAEALGPMIARYQEPSFFNYRAVNTELLPSPLPVAFLASYWENSLQDTRVMPVQSESVFSVESYNSLLQPSPFPALLDLEYYNGPQHIHFSKRYQLNCKGAVGEELETYKSYVSLLPKRLDGTVNALFPNLTELLGKNGIYNSDGTFIAGQQVLRTLELTAAASVLVRLAQLAAIMATKNVALSIALFPDPQSKVIRFDLEKVGLSVDQARAFFQMSDMEQRLLCSQPSYQKFCAALNEIEFKTMLSNGDAI